MKKRLYMANYTLKAKVLGMDGVEIASRALEIRLSEGANR